MPSQPDQPLKTDLYRSLRRRGMLDVAKAAWVLATANGLAKRRFTATSFRDGELIVTAGTLPVAELQLAKEQFKKATNAKLGQEIVRSIRVKQSSRQGE